MNLERAFYFAAIAACLFGFCACEFDCWLAGEGTLLLKPLVALYGMIAAGGCCLTIVYASILDAIKSTQE